MSDRPDTILFYGSTDSGKTLELGECAKWEYEHTGMISRLISADSGWDPIEELIISADNPKGIIESWNIQSLQDPWVILIELSEGAWPQVYQAPSGEWKIRMQRPKWQSEIEHKHVGMGPRIVCADGRLVGQYLIEGISTICSTGMQDHLRVGRKLAQDVIGSFTSKVEEITTDGKPASREMTFSAPALAHYGQIQRFLLDDLVPRFGRLNVNRVIWTGHEARGKDEFEVVTPGQGTSAFGPATIGRAVVDKTTFKFGHSFHFTVKTTVGKDAKGTDTVQRDFRAWFVSHPDETYTKTLWPAKLSLPKEKSLELLRKFPGGYIPRKDLGMGQFLEFLAQQFLLDREGATK